MGGKSNFYFAELRWKFLKNISGIINL